MRTFSDFYEDGLRKQSFYDETEDRLTFNTIQDVEPILKANKIDRENCDGTFKNGERGDKNRLYARIPTLTIFQWIKEGKIPKDYKIQDLYKMVNQEAPDLKTCNFHHEGIIK